MSDRVQFLAFLADMKSGGSEVQRVEVKLRCVAPGETSKHAHSVRFATYQPARGAAQPGRGFCRRRDGYFAGRRPIATRWSIARREVETAEIAKGRFLASVSHELRTPLNSIIGFSDVLLQEICGKLPDGRQREYVELVHRSGNHLLSVRQRYP